jgi:hypothetical protein
MPSVRRKRTPEERMETEKAGRARNVWNATLRQRRPPRSTSVKGGIRWPNDPRALEEVKNLSPGHGNEVKRLKKEGKNIRSGRRGGWTEWYEYGGKQYVCNALLGTCIVLGGAALAYLGHRGGGTRKRSKRRGTRKRNNKA